MAESLMEAYYELLAKTEQKEKERAYLCIAELERENVRLKADVERLKKIKNRFEEGV